MMNLNHFDGFSNLNNFQGSQFTVLTSVQPKKHGCSLAEALDELRQSRSIVALVLLLLGFSLLNLALGYWIVVNLQLGNNGLGNGNLLLIEKGIIIYPSAYIGRGLELESISSFGAGKVVLSGQEQMQLMSGEHDFRSSSLLLNNRGNQLEVKGHGFTVYGSKGKDEQLEFSLKSGKITSAITSKLKSSQSGGLKVSNFLASRSIRGDFSKDLRIESRTKSIKIDTSQLLLRSSVGELSLNSYKNLTLSARKVVLNADRVHFSFLPMSRARRHEHTSQSTKSNSYQICVCENGRSFLTPGELVCAASSEVCSTDDLAMS